MIEDQSRREFLRTTLITSAAVATGSLNFLNTTDAHAAEYPDVIVSYGTNPSEITRAAVDGLGGMARFVKQGSKVVIKPNMSFSSPPESASNTHPEVVMEVARMCEQAGASKISILDNTLRTPEDCLRMSRIPEYCKDIPKTSVNYIKAQRLFKEVKVPNGRQLKSMEVASEVLDADVLIAVPVGKSHGSSGVSLSMKGMMGLIYDRMSFHGRYDLHESIVDMVTILKPNLVVIDGTRILGSGGPGGPGEVIPLNLVVASTDMVAADAQMVALGTWYGKKFQPNQVKHIKIAAERGLGQSDLSKLNIRNIRS
ncbi:MAG: DUF362 domain-containing protein [Desulfomonilaceae bacterium]